MPPRTKNVGPTGAVCGEVSCGLWQWELNHWKWRWNSKIIAGRNLFRVGKGGDDRYFLPLDRDHNCDTLEQAVAFSVGYEAGYDHGHMSGESSERARHEKLRKEVAGGS